jgi:Right handed beta helix region
MIKHLVLIAIGVAGLAQAQTPCRPIVQRPDNDGYVQDHGITQRGQYCLQEDIFVKGHRSWAEGGRIFNTSKIIVNIGADDVVLNLGGHTAWSDGRLDAGIESTLADQNVPLDKPPKNITVRNGLVRLERSGIGIRFSGLGGIWYDKLPISSSSDFKEPKAPYKLTGAELDSFFNSMREASASEATRVWSLLPATPTKYPIRNLTIEHMHIRTREAALVLQGAGTVIRDNVIEVDDGTAIWLYGPGAVIENNTIIVNGDGERILEADAPIRLHHGDGAVIRNNKIVVKGKAPRRVVSTFETGDFTLQDNRIFGVEQPDDAAKAFRGTLQMQAKGNSFAPAWKAMFAQPK